MNKHENNTTHRPTPTQATLERHVRWLESVSDELDNTMRTIKALYEEYQLHEDILTNHPSFGVSQSKRLQTVLSHLRNARKTNGNLAVLTYDKWNYLYNKNKYH